MVSIHLQRRLQSPRKPFLSYMPSANTQAMAVRRKIFFLWQLAILTPQQYSFLFIAHLQWVVQCMVFTAFLSIPWVLHHCVSTDVRPWVGCEMQLSSFFFIFSTFTMALHNDRWFCLWASIAWIFLHLSPNDPPLYLFFPEWWVKVSIISLP